MSTLGRDPEARLTAVFFERRDYYTLKIPVQQKLHESTQPRQPVEKTPLPQSADRP